MVYQLLKFKSSRWMWGSALFVALLFVAVYKFSPTLSGLVVPILVAFLGWSVMWSASFPQRYSLFEAVLPINTRDLFCAKVLFGASWLWLFLLSFLAAIQYPHSASSAVVTVSTFEAGPILTLAHIALCSVRAGEMSTPSWCKWAMGVPALISVGVLSISYATSIPVVQAVGVLAICVLSSVVLFMKTWTSLPNSFRIAPAQSPVQKASNISLPWPSLVWWPAMRPFFDNGSILLLCVLLAVGWKGGLFPGIFFIFMLFVRVSVQLRTGARWMCSLPISRHTIFAALVLTPLGSFTLGSLIRLHSSSQVAEVVILEVAVVTATSLLASFVIQLPKYAIGLPRVWARLLGLAAYLVLPLGWEIWRWFGSEIYAGNARTTRIEALFVSVPQARLHLWIVISIVIVGSLYGMAYTGFRRMEISPQRLTPAK